LQPPLIPLMLLFIKILLANLMDKKVLINNCLDLLQKQLVVIKQSADVIQEQINEYGPNKDRYDSFRTKMMRSKEMYLAQMENIFTQIITLSLIDTEKKFTKVEFGSIVQTDKQQYFIATGIGKMKLEESDYLVISVNAPIFLAMKDKIPNETFIFNNIKHRIIIIL
jgi:hypothetical protein